MHVCGFIICAIYIYAVDQQGSTHETKLACNWQNFIQKDKKRPQRSDILSEDEFMVSLLFLPF